ncbi:MAG: phage terminase large subunit [Crocinitomicaceae bacterium]|nr:phage terminase large subunit [Crocinitomicaceae bacterium]
MSLTDDEIYELERLLYEEQVDKGKESLFEFTKTTFRKFKPAWFHKKFYDILNRFANKEIPRLMITMPPQHGKSEGSSRRLPAYIAGKRPDDKIALVSYAATKAQKFGREIMSIMREPEYKDIFPEVQYPERGYTGAKANTNMERESINSEGSMKFVGVDGPLTGDTVDILILDDLYKGWKDANSPVTQKAVWDWYLTVADTRLHNDSQQLITFTRWSDQDLIAKLDDLGLVVQYNGEEDIEDVIDSLRHDQFLLINFQALKEEDPSEFDPREKGDALWEDKHSKRKLESTRSKDPNKFDCLHQGNPTNKEGMLYANEFKTYSVTPEFKIKKNYTDTADTGDNYLCSIVYGVPLAETDPHYYVTDLLYTDKGMEYSEVETAKLLNRNKVNESWIESNNGGRSFARNVAKLVEEGVNIEWFHQGNNKEARIVSNSASVNKLIVFPSDWHIRWPVFYKHVTKYLKLFKMNKVDDAPDTLTGIIEMEIDYSEEDDQTTESLNRLGIDY